MKDSNVGKHGGPSTPAGKQRSSKNAVRHGLLSREIKLSDDERTEFEALRTSLREELQPSTGLQEFLFDEILVGMWKCKIALVLNFESCSAASRSQRKKRAETNLAR